MRQEVCGALVRHAEALGVERVARRVLQQVLEAGRVNVDVPLHEKGELRRVRVGTEDRAKVAIDEHLHLGLQLFMDVYELPDKLVVLLPFQRVTRCDQIDADPLHFVKSTNKPAGSVRHVGRPGSCA